MIKRDNFYNFEIFKNQFGLIQAVSTRQLGDMTDLDKEKRDKNRKQFLNLLGLSLANLVTMEQVHGSGVKTVGKKDRGKEIKGVDGLVTRERNIVLAVKTADCAQIVAFDFKKRILGTAHAGWRGVIGKVGYNLIKKMEGLGANPENVSVGIGPHICSDCYRFGEDLIDRFVRTFGRLSGMVVEKKNGSYLNLLAPLSFQLVKAGILKENIESANLCPACKNNEFFSFRKEGRPVGEFLAIAMIKGA